MDEQGTAGERAIARVEARYQREAGEYEEFLIDELTDLLHWASSKAMDGDGWDTALSTAFSHFDAETNEAS